MNENEANELKELFNFIDKIPLHLDWHSIVEEGDTVIAKNKEGAVVAIMPKEVWEDIVKHYENNEQESND